MIGLTVIILGLAGWMLFSRKYKKLFPQLFYLALMSSFAFLGVHFGFFVFDFQTFEKDNFILNFLKMLPGFVILLLVMGFFRYRKFACFPKPGEKFWLIMALYPFFGFFQQILVLAFLYPNFLVIFPAFWATIFPALFFGLAHYPHRTLTPVAFSLQLLTIILYRFFFPNIFVLGLYLGLFGTCFFYLILQDDVWKRKIE